MKPDAKPRKWTLHFLYGSCKVEAANEQFILNEEHIPVIEHSAYQALETENAKLQDDLNKTRAGLHLSSQTVAELEKENARLREKLDKACTMFDKRQTEAIEAEEERDRLREALETIADVTSAFSSTRNESYRDFELREIARQALHGPREGE